MILGGTSVGGLPLAGLDDPAPVVSEGRMQVAADPRHLGSGWLLEPSRRGIDLLRERLEKEKRDRKLPDKVARVIAEVAQKQAMSTAEVLDEVRYTKELIAALEAAQVAWKRSYEDVLRSYRDAFRTQQIASLLEMSGVYAQAEAEVARLRERNYWDVAVTLLLLQ